MPYLTYRLAQFCTAVMKASDIYYHDTVGLKIRELRILRLLHDMPGSTPTTLLANLELDKNPALEKPCSLGTAWPDQPNH